MNDFTNLNWTHQNKRIVDIRRSNGLYVISIDTTEFTRPLFVDARIFEERMNSYFLGNAWNRNDVLDVEWNFYITKGHYIKYTKDKTITKHESNPDKNYISFLEISGPLGTMKNTVKEV
jgi:hypothetical protein